MFTVVFHDEAEIELLSLPTTLCARMVRQLQKLEVNPQHLREPDTKYLGNGLFEIRAKAGDLARGLWVYQSERKIYVVRIFVKKTLKTPAREIALARLRVEEMKKNG